MGQQASRGCRNGAYRGSERWRRRRTCLWQPMPQWLLRYQGASVAQRCLLLQEAQQRRCGGA